jgi:hypothetical protein
MCAGGAVVRSMHDSRMCLHGCPGGRCVKCYRESARKKETVTCNTNKPMYIFTRVPRVAGV